METIMTREIEEKVIEFVTRFVEQEESLVPVKEFNAFITHGQNLLVYLDKDFKEPLDDMKEIGERIKQAVCQNFALDFDLRNWGHRHVDLILKIEQCAK